MTMIVRAVRKRDWPAVLAVEGELWHPWDLQDHREWLRPERNVTAVATDGQRLYGFVSATIMPKYVLVERLAVDPQFRRMGVGRGMLDALWHWFVTPERRQGQALVSEYDLGTQLFLRACGWKWAKSVRWGDEADEYLFLKEFE